MRSFLFPLVCCACIAQNPEGLLSFDRTHHDFGKVSADRPVSHRFKATNRGTGPLQIRQVVPSCGCTYTMVGQWYLKPGESTEIDATFNPAGMRGPVRKSMQVISDDPANPSIQLSFEAVVIQDVMPSTTALFFDDVPRNALRPGVVRLMSGNGQQVQVVDIKSPMAPYLTGTFKAEGKDAVVDVKLDPKKLPSGKTNGVDVITIRTTSERSPMIHVTVQWSLRAAVVATPPRVVWEESAGKTLKAAIQLRQVDGRTFRVLSAKPSNPLLWVEGLGQGSASVQNLNVVLDGKAKPGTFFERVLLTLDDPEQPELEIRVAAVLR
ncbi:MAG: DUF1573 domain-containing protein [Firmicutes bacterium]|nr:DUF1573 domain-containing protein [Bacillota bacterium]